MGKNIIVILILSVFSLQAKSEGLLDDVTYYGRLGYSIGGTMPMGMPASIRSLERYTLKSNVVLSVDTYKPLRGRWGMMMGLHLDNKGMKTDAQVKNYSMEMRQGGEILRGRFTGYVVTDVDQCELTVPMQGVYSLSDKVRLRLGFYVSYLLSNKFEGYAYDGYLRVGDPTGEKVELGNDEASRGDYDFSDDMRKWQLGVMAGADWYFSHHFGLYVDLSCGLTGVFKSDFNIIEQTMYPIFGTIGIIYKLN